MEEFGVLFLLIAGLAALAGYSALWFNVGSSDKDEEWRKWCVERGYAQYNSKTGEWEEIPGA